MKKKNLFYIILSVVAISLVVISCQKEAVKTPEVIAAEDDANADIMFDAVFTEVENATASMEDAIYGGNLKSAEIETCKTITVDIPGDSIVWPKTITVDFGDGCPAPNGRVRKGKIIIEVSNKVSSPTYTRTITFENFYIDGFQIEGTKTIAKAGLSDNSNPLFTITLVNGKITSPEGKFVTREFTHTREWIEGYLTPRNRFDDEYNITGNASGVDRNGVNYAKLIILPLHVKINCQWVVSGSIKLSRTDKNDIVIDYGEGECDRIATITIGEETRTINLHR